MSMHFITKYTGSIMRARAFDPPPMGPGFKVVPEGAQSMEVWGTMINHEGPDFTEFRLLNSQGRVMQIRTLRGY
jgi:hypothetical protein